MRKNDIGMDVWQLSAKSLYRKIVVHTVPVYKNVCIKNVVWKNSYQNNPHTKGI